MLVMDCSYRRYDLWRGGSKELKSSRIATDTCSRQVRQCYCDHLRTERPSCSGRAMPSFFILRKSVVL